MFWLVVIIPVLIAACLPVLRTALSARLQGILTSAALLSLFIAAVTQTTAVSLQPFSEQIDWVPQLGLTISLYVDSLALLFILIVTGIGAAIHMYAGYYFEDNQETGRFLTYLLAFTGSMLALVTAGNLFTLFVAWELTSILSFLLISFKGKEERARAGAVQALVITGGGGLALLGGLSLLSVASGTSDIVTILSSPETLQSHAWYPAFTLLILLGCFTKSAQFPFHFWLPDAMSAPTPASGFLHSATMVKAGVYLLLRLQPVLGENTLWTTLVPLVGFSTMLIGALLALKQRDLKGALAYSTISQLGAFVGLIGLPDSAGMKAAIIGVVAHAVYKSALFLIVGAIDHGTGTRDLMKLGGLQKRFPLLAAATAIAALSMAGVPPLLGFVGKETLIEATISDLYALILVMFSAALTVAMAAILYWDVFRGAPTPAQANSGHGHGHAVPQMMVLPPLTLAVLSLLIGILVQPLLQPFTKSILDDTASVYLFAPGIINEAFVLSMLALALGAGLFTLRSTWRRIEVPLPSGNRIYNMTVKMVERLGDAVLTTQNGRVRSYIFVILTSVSLMVAFATGRALSQVPVFTVIISSASDVLKAILILLSLGGVLVSILVRRHLIAALSLGVSGYAIGGIFLLEPAPDVALVQFLVETLATILIMMVLTKTSAQERQRVMDLLWDRKRPLTLWRDIAIASIVGVGVTFIAMTALANRPTPQTVSQWHLENSYPQTGATDVVAAIVTDFRGMDTLIEISVFSMAALGVLTLLATPELVRGRPDSTRFARLRRLLPAGRQDETNTDSTEVSSQYAVLRPTDSSSEQLASSSPQSSFSNPMTRMISNVVMPVAFLIALTHLFYGGSAPGDGFTAGVIAGLAIALWYIVYGYSGTREQLRWLRPSLFIGLGLFIGCANAAAPLLFGQPFLFHWSLDTDLPAGLKVSSTLIFEIAIFLCVAGGTSAIMEAITHPKEVEPL